MRRTGSREPRDSREASATSPFSIAVKTFSIRLGSRRIQRPSHQKIRSTTTARPMIDTIRIGHMMGPPLRKLSMMKLPVSFGFSGTPAEALGAAAGFGTPAAVEGLIPGAGDRPGIPGCVPGAVGAATGAVPFCGAPGAIVAAGIVPGAVVVVAGPVVVAGGTPAAVGAVVGGAPAPAGGGGFVCPKEFSASSAAEQTEAVRSFFIRLMERLMYQSGIF